MKLAITADAKAPTAPGAHSNGGSSFWQSVTSGQMSSRLQHVLAAAWILIITAAVLAPALARGPMIGTYDLLRSSGLSSEAGVTLHGSYTSSDLIATNIPWTILNWTQVHHGILPLWNPYNGLGLPLAFDWQSASFGLPSLVGYLLPLRLAVTGGAIVTLLVAGTGAYVLGRTLRLGLAGSLMVATVFELSGPLISWLGYPLAGVMSWGGWLFAAGLLVLKEGHRASSVAVFAVVTALAIYAGHPESLIAMEIALLVFLLAMLASRALPGFGCESGPIRRPAFDLAIGTAAGCALGGPLLLPALQLTATSVRSASTATSALPVHDLLYIVFSGFDGITVPGNFGFNGSFFYNETAAYVGSIAVALALIGVVAAVRTRRAEFLALSIMVIVTGALVFWAPALHLIEHVPNIGDVNWIRALMPLSLGLAALAGMGMDAVTKSVKMPATRKWFAGVFAGATLLMTLLWLFGRNGGLPNSSLRAFLFHFRAQSFMWPAVGLAVGLAGGLLLLWRPAAGRLVAALLLGFESIFLVTSGAVQIGSSTQGIVDTPAVNALKASVGNAVVGFGRGGRECGLGVTPEANIALRLHEFDLYDPIVPKSYFATWSQMSGTVGGGKNAYNLFCPSIQTVTEAQNLGIQYVIESAGDPGPPGSVFVKSIRVPNPATNPLAKPPPDEDLYRIPDAASVTLTAVGRGRTSGGVAVPLRVNDSNPAHWSVISNASTAGVLQIHLTNIPGWSATIDGRPLALEGSSVFLLQAKIPPGRHVITLNYWPSTFTEGIAAAIVAVLLLTGWILIDERRKGRTPLRA